MTSNTLSGDLGIQLPADSKPFWKRRLNESKTLAITKIKNSWDKE